MMATSSSPTLEATGPHLTCKQKLSRGRLWRLRKKNEEIPIYKETRVCRHCGCHGHLAHYHSRPCTVPALLTGGCAWLMPSRWWASSMYSLIDTLTRTHQPGTDHESYDDDVSPSSSPSSSPRTSSLVHQIKTALRPEWSEPPHGGNWSEPSYGANWSVPPGNWSEPPHVDDVLSISSSSPSSSLSTSSLVHRIKIALRANWSERPHIGNWPDTPLPEPSYRGNWPDTPLTEPGYGGNWSEPLHGGNWSEPSCGGNWSETPHGGNWSEPSYGGNWSETPYRGNWSEPSYGGNWSKPNYDGNWSHGGS